MLGPGLSNLEKVDNMEIRVNLLTTFATIFISRASRPVETVRGRGDLSANFRDV